MNWNSSHPNPATVFTTNSKISVSVSQASPPRPFTLQPTMCHAASQIHTCGHSAIMWTYCRESNMSGKGTAPPDCRERTWGKAVKSTEPCSLAFCGFKPGSTWYAHQPICLELMKTVADAVVVQDLLHVWRYPEYGRVVCPFTWQMGAR